jgi:hypothetical protein
MVSGYKLFSVMSCMSIVLLIAGCQSTTGKTAGQTLNDASISTGVQMKLLRDRLSNFTRIDVEPLPGCTGNMRRIIFVASGFQIIIPW